MAQSYQKQTDPNDLPIDVLFLIKLRLTVARSAKAQLTFRNRGTTAGHQDGDIVVANFSGID